MGFDTPSAISEGGIRAIREGRTKYAPVSGREPLREVIRKSISRDHGRDHGIDQISVGCGAKQVSFNAPCASLDPGDQAVFPTVVPGSPIPAPAAGGRFSSFAMNSTASRCAALALDAMITPRTKWLILNSLRNPTGANATCLRSPRCCTAIPSCAVRRHL